MAFGYFANPRFTQQENDGTMVSIENSELPPNLRD